MKITTFSIVTALALLAAENLALAASPARYRCQELTHAVDGVRCRAHPSKGILYFTISAPPGTPLRERAEVRLKEVVQQAATEFKDKKQAPPAVVIRARGPEGEYLDQRCNKPGECYGWEPRQAVMDKAFPPDTDTQPVRN